MWYEALRENFFIKKLYNKVPNLEQIRIYNINLEHEGKTISIRFSLPKYADNPPKKWIGKNYNTITVEVSFFFIDTLNIKLISKEYFNGNINISLDKDDYIHLEINGSINAYIKAKVGIIQKVSAYHCSLEEDLNS